MKRSSAATASHLLAGALSAISLFASPVVHADDANMVGKQVLALKGDPVAARGKVSMCIGCHGIRGYKTSYPEVYAVPMLGGQNALYLEHALREYRSGQRSHPTMRGIAESLSDQDIADLAAYYSIQK